MKNDVPSGIGITLLIGDSEAIRRLLSTSSSSNSNWPSSSSVKNRGKKYVIIGIWAEKLPIFRGEDKKGALFGHGFAFFCAIGTHGRTLLQLIAIINWI